MICSIQPFTVVYSMPTDYGQITDCDKAVATLHGYL